MTHELIADSGLTFVDVGIHELKGTSGRGSCTALLRLSMRDGHSPLPRDRLAWGLRLSTRARP
jgi:hypothetical protein